MTRFCKLSNAIKAAAESNGKKLMEDANLGFLGTCPSNLGTGLRASFMIVLPELNKDPHKLEEICAGFDLQPRGSSGEHSAAVGAKWDISNKQRIGFTEVAAGAEDDRRCHQAHCDLEEELAAANKGFKLPEIEPSFDQWLSTQLEASPPDAKDTDEFRYITFTELPPFTDKHKSLMRKTMTPELFDKLKDVKSSKGYSLSNGMQAGVLRPHLGVGFTCGDEECFTLFKDVIYPIVQGWHKFDPASQEHKSDLDWNKLTFSAEQAAKFSEYVKSTRVRAARNISGLSLPAGSSKEERLEVESVLKQAFASLPEDLQGTYYPLGELSKEQEDGLQAGGFLFQKPGPMQLLGAAGAGRELAGGPWHLPQPAQDGAVLVQRGGPVPHHRHGERRRRQGRVRRASASCPTPSRQRPRATGKKLMEHSEPRASLGTCPSNLGTGLRGCVHDCAAGAEQGPSQARGDLRRLRPAAARIVGRAQRCRRRQVGHFEQAAHRLHGGAAGAEDDRRRQEAHRVSRRSLLPRPL